MSMKFIEGDDALRSRKCFEEIQKILDRYDCQLVPVTTIAAGHISQAINLVAKNRDKPVEGKPIILK